jgi:hypothetical protein
MLYDLKPKIDAAETWVMEETNSWVGWRLTAGPILNLTGMAICVIVIWITGNQVGDVSCRYRLSYSPKNGAFSIWGLIFAWSFASIFFQLIRGFNPETFYVARFESNMLMGVSWATSAAWVFFFGTTDSPNPENGLGFAAFFLLLGSISSMFSVLWEQGYRSDAKLVQVLTVSIPFSLYAGWLIVAASINVGIFFKVSNANSTQPLTCVRDPENPSEPLIPDPESVFDLVLPIVLACVVSAVAITQMDFVLPLPLFWAICFMKLNGIKIASIVVLAISSVVSFVLFLVARG